MKRVVFILLLFLANNAFAQKHYSKMYDLFGGWESAFSVLKVDTDGVYFSGTSIDFTIDSLKYRRLVIFKISNSGEIKLQQVFSKWGYDYGVDTKTITIGNDEKYLVVVYDSIKNQYGYVNVNDLPDSLKINFISNPEKFGINASVVLDKKIFLFGTDASISPYPLAISVVDSINNLLWYKQYNYSFKRYRVNNVVVSNDGNLLIGGFLYKGNGTGQDSTFGWYAKMDTAGNFIWEKLLNDTLGLKLRLNPVAVYKINGICYLTGGDVTLNQKAYGYLMKIDENNGNVNWVKKVVDGYYSNGKYMFCDIYELKERNNNIYAIGNFRVEDSITSYTEYIQFVKLDTAGNLKWKRLFKQWYKDNRGWSLTAIPDGFITCADGKDETHTTGFTDAWIIKTDTNGCIIPGCHLSDGIKEIIDVKNYLMLYPNPASNKINVSFSDPNQTKIERIEVFDEKGATVTLSLTKGDLRAHSSGLRQAQPDSMEVNIEQLKCGMYYLAAYFDKDKRVVKKFVVEK